VCFEEKDLDKLELTMHTPLFAGVTVFRKVIEKLGGSKLLAAEPIKKMA
jgi:hypothetical protein